MLKQFFYEEEGQALVEYGLIASLIALGTLLVLKTLGSRMQTSFNKAADSLNVAT